MTSKFNKIRYLLCSGLVAVVAVILSGHSSEAAPKAVAIVENSARNEGLGQAFDMLPENTILDLAQGETIVLGYLKSCVRETITGGKVTVGLKESAVEGGTVAREKTECTETRLALTADESQQSATIAFRGQIKHIFTRQPIIIARKSAGVIIEPINGGETWKIEPKNERIDFQAAKLEMQPGVAYRVKGFTQTVIVEVDRNATKAKTGTLERVVILD
ncbi:hypothetical protein [Dongia sp.]|jgi:hypothetical protein|uniref:hypothetical protein n=1 Tax=Dongia sp. TaxID=1977262 RepID=UPI0035B3F371